MLYGLRVRPAQKAGLAAIFALAVVDMALDVARTMSSLDPNDIAMNTLWNLLEPTIGVMICALPTYRALLRGRAGRRRHPRQSTGRGSTILSWLPFLRSSQVRTSLRSRPSRPSRKTSSEQFSDVEGVSTASMV